MTSVEDLVVLVDERGNPIGEQRKSLVHNAATPLHLAFSLYLFDDAGRVLFTRRALSKQTWPGVWTNSCCGHPGMGESQPAAISRRLGVELGMSISDVQCALPDFAYRARDASGIWENEICPVFVGRVEPGAATPDPNPAEVMEWVWTDWEQLVSAVASTPFAFSPWSVLQVAQLAMSPLVRSVALSR